MNGDWAETEEVTEMKVMVKFRRHHAGRQEAEVHNLSPAEVEALLRSRTPQECGCCAAVAFGERGFHATLDQGGFKTWNRLDYRCDPANWPAIVGADA